eukprot:g1104.t1
MPIGYGCTPELRWSQPRAEGTSPAARAGHSLTLVTRTQAMMFGGCTSAGLSNDVYILDMSAGSQLRWARAAAPGPKAAVPPPRWRHSATAVSEGRRVAIFGGCDDDARLSDLWLLDTDTLSWLRATQLDPNAPRERRDSAADTPVEPVPPPPQGALGTLGWPSPRCAHSMCALGGSLYLFGGYGGAGFGRRDFNDLWRLETRSGASSRSRKHQVWAAYKLAPTGEKPAPRADHQATVLGAKMYVCGGWSAQGQFGDVHIFDSEACAWSQPECDAPPPGPVWQHSAVGAMAVPHAKLFVFGGESGDLDELHEAQGVFLDRVCVLNCDESDDIGGDDGGGQYEWSSPHVVGRRPQPRADCAVVYLCDGPRRQIVVFGGWSGHWLGDLHILDVQEVAGPPYNIESITTSLRSPPGCDCIVAPVTGGTALEIRGQNTQQFAGGAVVVQFECADGSADADGEVSDDGTTIRCEAPDVLSLGPVECQVRVRIDDYGLSLTALRAQFHTISAASQTLAFGPGLLRGNSAGFRTTFVVQAICADGSLRETGADEFRVTITPHENSEDGGAASAIHADIQDRLDGTYVVQYDAPGVGSYEVAVDFMGTFGGEAGPIMGSPFFVTFVEGKKQRAADNTMAGSVLRNYIKKSTEDLAKEMRNLERDLSVKVAKGKLDDLLRVKKGLMSLQSRHDEQQYTLLTTRRALLYLRDTVGQRVDNELQHVERVQEQFVMVHELAPKTADSIMQETNVQKQLKKKDVAEYQRSLEQKQRQFRKNKVWDYATGVESARRALREQSKSNELERRTLAVKAEQCTIFGFPEIIQRCGEIMDETKTDMAHMSAAWDVIEHVQNAIGEARTQLWSRLNCEEFLDDAKALYKKVNSVHKVVKTCNAFSGIKALAQGFIKQGELIQMLKGNPMEIRHWEQLARAVGHDFSPPPQKPGLLVGELLDLHLDAVSEYVEDITDLSAKERKLELILSEIDAGKGSWVGWRKAEWVMEPYKGTDTPLLNIDPEHYETLEKHQMDIQAQLTSKAMDHFEKEVHAWQRELGMVSENYRLLSDMQRAWSYLEPLFIHSDEVRKELPETAAKFKDIDADVRAILTESWRVRVILTACNKDGLEDRLEEIVTRLAVCKKSLIDFLDGRKRQFPRFYFMSEADLLDVLSNGSQPKKVIAHVPKIYLATKTFKLEEHGSGRPTATHWVAGIGSETVTFEPAVTLEGKVEVYLQTVVNAMRATMFQHLRKSLSRYAQMQRIEWVMHGGASPSDMAQVILLVSAIKFADGVEQKAFGGLKTGKSDALQRFSDIQVKDLGDLIKLTRTKLTGGQRKRVMCMITLDAHNRDVVTTMIHLGVQKSEHFKWQSLLKLRFCEPPADKGFPERDPELRYQGRRAECQILNAVLPYDYEYLGNGPRLVITPLTDRIYVTATQALSLMMGCAPAGPAGTGKTETTKDLAAALGKACYVINCSPEMDYQSMGNIWKGLASSGSWGCFDEFNRLIPEVLSVCSVQFKSVCDGCKAAAKMICVDGDEITLDPTVGAFITMNPGYLGRSELPEGLKALFRPMTVMVPDMVLICENMLMAEGFETAKVLASKFFGLYALLSKLLSKQRHYDWGLRAVKSVLVVAGQFKRAEPDMEEGHLLMRALRDFNTPKIVAEDEIIFHGLLGDLFPGAEPPRAIDEELEKYVKEACVKVGNDPDELFRLKVVQFEELTQVRHCVFIMGPAGAGKSQVWRTLAKARELQGPERRTKCVDVNPKAIATKELYGYIVMATREWKDGLLSKTMRTLGEIPDEKPKWIILDGDLDANWIESMNSVMDDNRMLTLVSGERIPLLPHMRMIFEIRDLAHATPATVTRAGVLYISTDAGSQWRSLIHSWVSAQQKPTEIKKYLQALCDKYLPESLLFVKARLKTVVPVEDIHLVSTLTFMLDGMLSNPAVAKRLADAAEWQDALHKVFVFCAVWACGSGLGVSDGGVDQSKMFSDWWRSTWRDIKVGNSANKNVNEYFLNTNGSGAMKFEPWSKNRDFFYPVLFDSKKQAMSSVMVPTGETCAVAYWMDLLIKRGKPVMLCGAAGTGKTQLTSGCLGRIGDPSEWLSCTINFNFYTSAAVLQGSLEGPVDKRSGTKYGPAGKAQLIYFVDDLNLPELDTYNTQDAIALLRQHLEYGRIYDRNKDFIEKHIQNTQLVSCMNPTVGSFVINPRLQRHFTTFAVGMPSKGALQEIYETFLLKRDESDNVIGGHLGGWSTEFHKIAKNIVNAALNLHSLISESFRKTAKNFHYEFNVRHLSNVFQGLLVAQPEQFLEPCKLVELWLHESERVYSDRLVCTADVKKYEMLAKKTYLAMFTGSEFAKIGRFFGESSYPLIFCHFCDNYDEDRDKKVYDQAEVLRIAPVLTSALADYNTQFPAMNLSLFEDAMMHVCRTVRIVLNFGGHALLVGVGGSGKQSLSRLSAFVCQYTVKQIVISSTYDEAQFLEDLRVMYHMAGVKDEGVMFLLTDSQIVSEKFLVYLNDLLSSGNIPDLYGQETRDEIIAALLTRVKRLGLSTSPASVWDFFISQIRTNLHCCLCFSPVSESFRTRAARFPALVNCTVIDWFQPWPEDALHAVGQKFLSHIEDLGSDTVRSAIEDFMPFAFASVGAAAAEIGEVERRHVHTTPKSYLEMVTLYFTLLLQQRKDCNRAIDRLQSGLEKIESAGRVVAEIEAKLKIDVADAEKKKSAAEGIAETVAKEKAQVEVENVKAEKEQVEVTKIQKDVDIQQRQAKKELDAANPAVEEAMAALDTIKENEVKDVARLGTPPGQVGKICEAVMTLLCGVKKEIPTKKSRKDLVCKDKTWGAIKKFLLNDVKSLIEDYLKRFADLIEQGKVPERNFVEVRAYLDGEDDVRGVGMTKYFKPEIIAPQSSSAAGLCMWCIAITKYYDIVITVAPLRKALAEAEEQLADANARLATVNAQVKELNDRLAVLVGQFEEAETTKQNAIDIVDRGMKKQDLAQRLTAALSSEKVRWAENVTELNAKRELLIGDVLLASAFVSYVGPFTKPFRESLIENWTNRMRTAIDGEPMPMSEVSDPVDIVATSAARASWQSDGLPSDRISTENGAIVCTSRRWPLMIDPQLQGINWVRNKEGAANRNLQIVRLGNANLLAKIGSAVENGHSILIENILESIDAVLNPVIQRAKTKKGSRYKMKLGDQELDYNDEFRLFLHTKLSNPNFPPEVQAECALVNFTVTSAGLEDQMLALVVAKERPDLARTSVELVQQQNQFKIKMQELEDEILHRLAEAEGDITENEELIVGLEDAKRVSIDIATKSTEATTVQATIAVTSEKYRSVASRTSLLFFLMNDLVKIHTYYIYSLAAFIKVFDLGVDKVSAKPGQTLAGDEDKKKREKGEEEESDGGGAVDASSAHAPALTDEELAQRCEVLSNSITLTTFNYIRRGLLEKDKLMVATLLALRILLQDGTLQAETAGHLIRPERVTDAGDMGQLGEWLPSSLWPKLKGLELHKTFRGFASAMLSDEEDWQKWFDSSDAELAKLPGDYNKLVGPFDRMVLLRALRPDRLPSALRSWVSDVLGQAFVSQAPYNMEATFRETSPTTPVFFVLFPGVDPTPWVEGLGRTLGMTEEAGKLSNISMGQGQEEAAAAVMTRFAETGGWVMLQNCHLMQSWLPTLERQFEVASASAHQDFRLFISAEPPPIASWKNMPESLMQSCIKVANESPADVQSNLRRSWANFSQARIDGCSKPSEMKSCLFSLCWFHAIVLGRRRFGQQGWSRKYPFNTGDLTICADVLQTYLEDNATVPFDDLRYVFGEIMYGGHITDPWDRRTNNTYLEVLFNERLASGLDLALGEGFAAPNAGEFSYDAYALYIEENMVAESPLIFGMHPNAEIGFLTAQSDDLFAQVQTLSGGGGGDDAASAGAGGDTVKSTLDELLERLPEPFNMVLLRDKTTPMMAGDSGPYISVALQECQRMNILLVLIKHTLVELGKGLRGQLNMSQGMEDLATALGKREVPGRNPFSACQWETPDPATTPAWPSKKSLLPWFHDLLLRVQQLVGWEAMLPERPFSLWLPGLFNPMAYLTALKQVTARSTGLALDKLAVETHLSTMWSASEADAHPHHGEYLHGLFIEGARWPRVGGGEESGGEGGGDESSGADSGGEDGGGAAGQGGAPHDVDGTTCAGVLAPSRLKELLPALPLVYAKAVEVQPRWESTAVGYFRNDPAIYDCPVYVTSFRGPTYVFLATLPTSENVSKWVLGGVAIIFQTDD